MRRMMAICKKELQMYFYSPIAYVAFAFYFLAASFLFTSDFLFGSRALDVRSIVGNMLFFYLIVIPLLTMRLISDELKQGTDELLLTSPVSLTEVVLGKYMATLVIQFALVAVSFIYPIIMSRFGAIDQPVFWLSYLSLFLLGASMMAVGLFASSLSAHQMISGIIAFVMLLLFWLISTLGDGILASVKSYVTKFSLIDRVQEFQKGVFNLSDFLFYITFIALFVILSIQVLERKRWR